ncbi:PDDEXK nuclease domain-containing protein [Flavobacterium sp. DGU11]|uniref:PDDEXK nuclease domain-containing protein n=1 Tax=Flavobacterium arundinis TaxID=3139143 RepID=A0ABU9HRV3_9FLAO
MLQDKTLIDEIKKLIASARETTIRSVDFQRTLLYWHIGERMFNEEQKGKERADYGTYLVKHLSEALQPEFGSGFSYRNLNWYRQFYKTFPIVSALRTQLSWTHYKTLIGFDDKDKIDYYIAETVKNNWSVRQMERQVNSQLFERLLLSNDKESVLAVARNEQLPTRPEEIIKDPMVLEFLGLRRESAYYEKDLEQAIITHLQDFLLELGNGFSFVARQKRIHLEGDDFFIDLVFYNRLLQCFVLFEIKTHKLTHEDIGQLQMYVNYFDRVEKVEHEKPTIGVLLCADKNNAVVRFSLPEDNKTILASQYKVILPTEEQLLNEIKKEIDLINEQQTN